MYQNWKDTLIQECFGDHLNKEYVELHISEDDPGTDRVEDERNKNRFK